MYLKRGSMGESNHPGSSFLIKNQEVCSSNLKRSGINTAVRDIVNSFKQYNLVGVLGWQDIAQRYRRSSLGAFWLTISMGVMIASIGLVFGKLLNSPMEVFLPFLTIGLILWSFIVSSLTEGCTGFINSEAIIKEIPLPLYVHILRVIWRNIIILAHNFVIFPLLCLFFGKGVGIEALISIPGFLVLAVNIAWLSLLCGVISTRYRDIPQVVNSILQVAFYVSPIMWMPELLEGKREAVLIDANPMHHLLEIVRAPLLGEIPTLTNWTVSFSILIVGWFITIVMYGRTKNKIAFWL